MRVVTNVSNVSATRYIELHSRLFCGLIVSCSCYYHYAEYVPALVLECVHARAHELRVVPFV